MSLKLDIKISSFFELNIILSEFIKIWFLSYPYIISDGLLSELTKDINWDDVRVGFCVEESANVNPDIVSCFSKSSNENDEENSIIKKIVFVFVCIILIGGSTFAIWHSNSLIHKDLLHILECKL